MKMKNFHKLISETKATCQAALLAALCVLFCSMTAMAQNIYYVKPLNEASKGNGSSWQDATTLYEALRQAEAGDEIRLMGYEKVDSREKVYVVPSEEGFTVPAGVKIYGGFSGTSGVQGRPGDSTVLDEKKNDGGHGRGAGSSGSGWDGNGGDVRGRVDKGVGEGKPSSSPNPGRAKVWLIAACVIVGLVAGFFLLRNLMSGGGQGNSGIVPSDSSLVAVSAPGDVSSRQPVSTGKESVKPSDSDMSSSVLAKPSSVKPVASSASDHDNSFQAALDSKDEQIAALQQQIKEEREQRTWDSLVAVQRLKERRQHIKDSVAAAKRAEQETAAREEAARKAEEEKARQEATRKAAEEARSTTGTINGHQWVDLGLSVKWATCNVGASSPSDYGGYYAWGETRTKSEYTTDNSSTYGINIGDISGDSRYDAARANWGGTWRLPTQAEVRELIDKCTWTWTSQGGHNGYRVTGPNGSSIFLPAAGYRLGSSLYGAGGYGYCWSSAPDWSDARRAYYLYFDSSGHSLYLFYRSNGQSVRPVSD